jgi:transposase
MAQQVCVVLNAAEREQLAAIAADRNRPRKHIERARIVLASADRHSAQRVAQSIGVSPPTVWRWQQRFAETGVEGLLRDKTRKPGKAPIAADKAAQLVALTCTQPPHQATHWTGRAMAKAIGLSLGSVQRIWRAHKLQPHRLRTFKRSRDPGFAASLALQPEKSRVLPNKGRAPDARLPYYGEGNQEQRFTDSVGATTFLKLQDVDTAPFSPTRAMPGDDGYARWSARSSKPRTPPECSVVMCSSSYTDTTTRWPRYSPGIAS